MMHTTTTQAITTADELYARLMNQEQPIHHARELAAELGIHPGTLASRFQRAGAPSPKYLINSALLVHVAQATQWRDFSFVTAARRLGFSSPQHLSRFIRETCHSSLEAVKHDPAGQLAEFRAEVTSRCADPITAALRVGLEVPR